jgi:diguanylate cyclase (GGDEF)-like protein
VSAPGHTPAPEAAPLPAPPPERPIDAPTDQAVHARVRDLQGRLAFESRLRRALAAVAEADEAIEVAGRAASQLITRGELRIFLSRQERPDHRPLPPGPRGDVDVSECSALRLGTTVTAGTTTDFDACAHLRSRATPGSAVCVPLTALGRPVAVIQWVGPVGLPLDAAQVQTLQTVAEISAPYLALLRASSVRPPESIDPLTGLLNHRSMESRIRELVRDLVPFSMALADVDHLQQLSTDHGTENADRSLRRLAEVLKATVRPGDIVGRIGSDEFLVVFPSCSTLDAAQAVERVRESLALSLAADGDPLFTASFGVSDSNGGGSIEEIVANAEAALQQAKDQGRNRTVVAGS